jgi:N-acetylmuramoyl-L-alanine amidase
VRGAGPLSGWKLFLIGAIACPLWAEPEISTQTVVAAPTEVTPEVKEEPKSVSRAKPLTGKVILLDPGHAVMDENNRIINAGARARIRNGGARERDVVLSVGAKIVPLLEAQGAKVFMTRTPLNAWRYSSQGRQADNRARAILANSLQVDAYVRLHCDWNRSRKFKGFTVFYYRWGSRRLATSLRAALVKALPGHTDHGQKRRTFVSVTSTMPAVLLELGVLSHRSEAKELGSDAYQTRLAAAIASGIVNYFETKGLETKIPDRDKSILPEPETKT